MTNNSDNKIPLDKSCRDCANFEQASESVGKCRVEARPGQEMKSVDFIACRFFRMGVR